MDADSTRELPAAAPPDPPSAGARLAVDDVARGFLTIDLQGAIAERSATMDRWFGEPAPQVTLADLVRPHSLDFAIWLELGLDALRDQLLPIDQCIDQLPRRFAANGRAYDVAYTPIPGDAGVEQLLVIVGDITDLERERTEREQRELLAVFQHVSSDRDTSAAFLRHASALVAGLETPRDRVVERRALHTLKGNCAMFGLERFAELCHAIENQLAEPGASGVLTDEHRARLRGGWDAVTEIVSRLLGNWPAHLLEVELPELAWRRFDRLGRYAVGLARRLGKGEIAIAIADGGVRLDPARWAPLWSVLIHAVRNAVDHGFAPHPAPRPPMLSFTARRTANQLTLTIADNGRGIDWEAVRTRARSAGLPHATHDDLVEALFVDGISTRESVTETSGRGVGLAALRSTVISLGGVVEIESRPDAGTCFTFRFALEGRSERRGTSSPLPRLHAP